MKTYSEKLKDPRWQRKRLEIMQRDDFKCQECGSGHKTLNIHHIRYIKGRDPWEYKNFYLVTLCEDCHKKEEDEIKSGIQKSAFDKIIEAAPETAFVAAPIKIHRIVAVLCELALHSQIARDEIITQKVMITESSGLLEGVEILQSILAKVTDSESAFRFMDSLKDREGSSNCLSFHGNIPSDEKRAAQDALSCFYQTLLQRRDKAIKNALKEPGLDNARMMDLLDQAKEISALFSTIGNRFEFDGELPASTWKEKAPLWKSWKGQKNQ